MCFPKIIVVGVAALCGVASFSVSLAETDFFLRGDVDGSSRLEMRDVLSVLRFLFLEGEEPSCLDAADSNDDGKLSLSDGVFTLRYLVAGGPLPPEPALSCGKDPTPDDLGCESFPSCDELLQLGLAAGQNDAGSGHDAGNTFATALSIQPGVVNGNVDLSIGDNADVYSVYVPQAFQLLRVELTPQAGQRLGLCLGDPQGRFRTYTNLLDPCTYQGVICCGTGKKGFGYTADMAGNWKIGVGGVNLAGCGYGGYTLEVTLGGGGDDCVGDAAAGQPDDAPNQGYAKLIEGNTDCVASLPPAEYDWRDNYAFEVKSGDRVDVQISPIVDIPAIRVEMRQPFDIGFLPYGYHSVFTARATGTVYLKLTSLANHASPPAHDMRYRLLITKT